MTNNTKIGFLIITVLLFIQTIGFSQRKLEYPEIFELIKEGDNDISYTLLLDYQKNNPDFANTYFQLGLIAHQWAFDFNPFTDYEYTKLFIYNTKLYFNLAKHKLTDEKKKNFDYYLNAIKLAEGEKISNETITAFIDKKNAEISEYEENIKEIIKYFNKSSDKYNECVNNFMIINAEYNNVKNLYLTDNDINDERINRLKIDFDSVLVYFDLYKQALNRYPLKGYNQIYELKDIITFRLDGLTASNFLDNEIILWNYKKWVQEVKEIQGKVISSNKDEISIKNEAIMKRIDKLSDASYTDTLKMIKPDEKFIYKIEKFDNNSFLLELFKLNEGIINYLILSNKTLNDPQKRDEYSLTQKAVYTLSFYEEYKKMKQLNSEFEKGINPEHIKKYKNFYMSAYNGIQGLKDYSFRQDLLLTEKKDFVFENLKQKLYSTTINPEYDSLYISNKKIETRKIIPGIETGSDHYSITDFKFDKNNRFIFSGFYKNQKNRISGYSGYKESSSNVPVIFKSLESDTCDIYNSLIEMCADGYFTVQTSVGKEIGNTLLKYNEAGKQVMKRALPYKKIPRFMFFDDITNTLTIIFNGRTINSTDEIDDEQIIYMINPDDELLNSEHTFNAKATVFDAIKLNNRYLLFSNYSYYKENETKKTPLNSRDENPGDILITLISVQGEVEQQIPLNLEYSVLGIKAVKINSDAINILGYKTTKSVYPGSNINQEELFWMIINSNVEPVFNGWHD